MEEIIKFNSKGDMIYHWTDRSGLLFIVEYDERGNRIHYKDNDTNTIETWDEYDANNNIIHRINIRGYEARWEYDDNGNVLHYRDNSRSRYNEYWKRYDDRGNCIYHKYADCDQWYIYDENNNKIYYKDSEGVEVWWEYDSMNRIVSHKIYDNGQVDSLIYYNENHDVVYSKKVWDDGVVEVWNTYNENGDLLHSKHSGTDNTIFEEWQEYDEKGELIRRIDSKGAEELREYDENGILTCIKHKYPFR